MNNVKNLESISELFSLMNLPIDQNSERRLNTPFVFREKKKSYRVAISDSTKDVFKEDPYSAKFGKRPPRVTEQQ